MPRLASLRTGLFLIGLWVLAATVAFAQSNECTISSSPPSDPNHPVAPGTVVTLTATCIHNPTTYSWSNGAVTQSIAVTAVAGTGMQYFFSGTNSAGVYTISYVINVAGSGSSSSSINTQVSGTAAGKDGSAQFVCFGMPTCTGPFNATIGHSGCSNNYSYSTTVTLTGLDLSHPGSISGIATLAATVGQIVNNANGSCTYTLAPGDGTAYSGTWDGKTGNIVVHDTDDAGDPKPITATFTASLPASSPVFPMTVSGSYSPSTTDVGATVQPPSQVVGKSGSLFVFAHAPSNLVGGSAPAKRAASSPSTGAAAMADAIVCVLAQVNSSGQLVAASASTMKAYLSGVLTSQSQAVEILNNVPTPNVAGATMYVGYGTDAANMFASDLYQTAISVPGAVQCTASLASAPAPTLPGAITGLWWNPNESGWGIHFTQRGGNIFAAWYTYDATGNPKWYVATCTGMTGTSGTCNGSLLEVNGPTFFGVTFVPISSNQVSTAGTLKLTFTDANNGSMNYTVGSVTRTVAVVRQPVGVGTLTPAVDYSDLWWNPNESGWGMAMAQQNANIFLAWYVYDATGKPVWYVASNCTVNGSSCSGALYSTTGPPFGPTFSGSIHVATAGSVIVSFIDANDAVLSYTVGGVTATKTITRQLF